MVKKLTILFFIFLIGCEINSEQLIKSERVDFKNIKFNTVSKNLNFKNSQSGIDVDYTKNLITEWFNNNIKTDGLEGNLKVNVNSIDINKTRDNEYYRFEISLSIEFIEINQILMRVKLFSTTTLEF